MPVSNGGTGASALAKDKILTGNDTEAVISSNNLIAKSIACNLGVAPEVGWRRVCEIAPTHWYGSLILFLTGQWSNSAPTVGTFAISVHNTKSNIQVIESCYTGYITKIRLVKASGVGHYYVDIYSNTTVTTTVGTVYLDFIGNMTITDMTITSPNLPLTTEETASSECSTHMTIDRPKFTVQDAYGENASTAVEFLHQDTILKLPTTIKAGLAGNAATATKLLNARTINGAAFDGSKNIEINNLVGAGNSKFYYVKAPPYTEISPSADDSEYFKELLKWICTKYPTAVDSIFIAPANPNGKGTVIIHIYDCAKVQDGIPQWSSGFYESVTGCTYVFRTNNYNYEFTENTFSTLPISKGGTSATTASQALTNLGAAAKSDLNKYLALAGGTLTGDVSSHNLKPVTTNTYELGTSALKWKNIYATTFTGDLTGKAATATKLAAATRIDGIAFDGSAAVNRYAVCETAAGTAAKTVTVTNFNLVNRSKSFYKIYSYKYSC